MEPSTSSITQLLRAWSNGEAAALEQLTPLVYGELHRVAAAYVARRRASLQPTEVVNEVFQRLLKHDQLVWPDRTRFFAFCAQVMRNILVDHFRRQPQQVSLSVAEDLPHTQDVNLLRLNEALNDYAALDPRACRVVELRFFSGLTEVEIAEALQISVPTVKRDWRKAKAWLKHQLQGERMNDERQRRLYRLYEQALELAPTARPAFLAQACSGDAAMQREIERLLAAAERSSEGGFLNTPALEKFADVLAAKPAPLGDKPMLLNGRYYIPNPSQPLAEGGFGKVYLAEDRELYNRRVIVKTLKAAPDPEINKYMHDKFQGDIDALTRFEEHPHIVGIHGQGLLPDSGEPYYVMDFVVGQTLREALRRERFDFARIARIIQQASHAISFAHERGVYHRDLKPDNLMLRSLDDYVVVIDFGIATVQQWEKERNRGDAPKKTMLVGTAEYMAPEQIEGQPCAASDTWALAVIGFELLTGQLPFAVPRDAQTKQVQWRTLWERLQSGVRVPPSALRPHLPAAVEPVLLQALACNPQHRHAETRAFGDALAAALLAAQAPASSQEPTEIVTRPTSAIAAPLSLPSLRALATPTNRLWPRLVSEARQARGMGAKPGSAPRRFRQGDRLRLVLDSEWEGHLLLLDEGPEGVCYCLCPSLFAPDTRLRLGILELPQPGACDNAFEITGEVCGREHLLAIVSEEPLGLDWLSRDAQQPARVLSQGDIDSLLARLRELEQNYWRAFTTHFEVEQ